MKPKRRFALGLLTTFLIHPLVEAGSLELTDPEEVGFSTERLERLKGYFEKQVEDRRTGGFQILVARKGKVVMHENIGMADIEADRPITDETLFRIFSMTKPVVGVAMMMLYEEGLFSLADPLAMHIPEFANIKVYAGDDENGEMLLEDPVRQPTIHDLMQHTAGFTYGLFDRSRIGEMYRELEVEGFDKTQQEFVNALAKIPLRYQPGERWAYSVAVDVQGYLIEKWTGKELMTVLDERIFGPLGMDETMAWVSADKAALLAQVYTHDEQGRLTRMSDRITNYATSKPARFAGGIQLISTSDDFWLFCQMLLNGGTLEDKRLLSPRSVAMMRQDRLDFPMPGPEWRRDQGFGLDFGVITDPSKVDYPVSNGEYYWAGLANTDFWIDPQQEIVAILLSQYLPYKFDGSFVDPFHRFVNFAVVD
jgi:CubicO group peptidase (beta-lactamase class C family)